MPASSLGLATPADDPALRSLLRDNPMPGSISLTYEREPDYFIAAQMEGSLSQTIVSVDQASGALLGMGTRVIRPMYLNGQVREVGYIGHLRVDRKRAWGLSLARELARSFGKLHELHCDGRVPFYLMSVISDNTAARRLLTSELPGMPRAQEYSRMFTYALAPRRTKPLLVLPQGMKLERGSYEQAPLILECLQRNAVRRQFSPAWTSGNLFMAEHTPGLRPEDFFLVTGRGRVLGCLALWDQTAFKQMVVRGYSGSMLRWRWAVNLAALVMDVPFLPPVGMAINSCFASHIAIDNDDARIFAALLRAAYNDTFRRGFNYFMIGLGEADPLRPLLTSSYLHITYRSQIYLVAWDDGLEAIAELDGRLPGLEIAVM